MEDRKEERDLDRPSRPAVSPSVRYLVPGVKKTIILSMSVEGLSAEEERTGGS